jgi:flagellar hook-length control protein FliK
LMNTTQKLPTAFAVSQWAQAVASGDMKSVEIIPGEEIQVAGASQLAASDHLTLKGAGEKTAPKLVEVPLTADQIVLGSKDRSLAATSTSPKNLDSLAGAQKNSKDQNAGFVAMVPKDLPQLRGAISELEQKKSSNSKSSNSESSEPVSARDFMLSNEIGMTDHSEKLTAKVAPALVNNQKIGSVEDGRVSHQAVEFVADKVETLRASGGGVLRVHLDPKNLGSVMLKVSSKAGVAKVEIIAEKPETAALLSQSKGDLYSRLQSSGIQASLSVDQGRLSGGSGASLLSQSGRAAGLSSFDIVSLDRSGNSEAQNSSAVKTAGSSANMQSAAGDGGGESWSRDERREFAREQQNTSRQNRKTA